MAKIAFITQGIGLYGADRSFKLTLKGLIDENYLKNEDIIIVYAKAIKYYLNYKLEERFHNSYLSNFDNVKSWILPHNCETADVSFTILVKIKSFIRMFIFFIFWITKYKRQFKRENVTQIYLSGVTLWPMLLVFPKNIKIITHIREIFDVNKPFSKMVRKLIANKSSELIAIDKKTALPFLDINKEVIIMRNPFEMKKARKLKKSKYVDLCKKYGLNPNKIHVSLIGRVVAHKGQKFFCNIAEKFDGSDNFEFIIVGKGKGSYCNDIINKVKNIKNLYYIGEIENIEEIYAITHINIRCDNFFPLGRTVWEAYYAGCKVLLPYYIGDDVSEIKDYLNKEMFLYNVKNVDSALLKLKEIKEYGFDVNNNLPTGNLKIYTKRFNNVLQFKK